MGSASPHLEHGQSKWEPQLSDGTVAPPELEIMGLIVMVNNRDRDD